MYRCKLPSKFFTGVCSLSAFGRQPVAELAQLLRFRQAANRWGWATMYIYTCAR